MTRNRRTMRRSFKRWGTMRKSRKATGRRTTRARRSSKRVGSFKRVAKRTAKRFGFGKTTRFGARKSMKRRPKARKTRTMKAFKFSNYAFKTTYRYGRKMNSRRKAA